MARRSYARTGKQATVGGQGREMWLAWTGLCVIGKRRKQTWRKKKEKKRKKAKEWAYILGGSSHFLQSLDQT